MEKIALIEINVNYIEMSLVDVNPSKSYKVFDRLTLPIKLGSDLESEEIIKPNTIHEAIDILVTLKQICNSHNVTNVIAYANGAFAEAKNHQGFINEVFVATGFKVNIIPAEEEIAHVYTSVINTFNRPKGLIVNVSNMSTQILLYNRRNILNVTTINIGAMNGTELIANEGLAALEARVLDGLKDAGYISELEEEFDLILAGNVALNLASLVKRAKRYPLSLSHNLEFSKEDEGKVFSAISQAGINHNSKVKGVSAIDSPLLLAGLDIIHTIISKVNRDTMCVCQYGVGDGLLLNYALPITLEKPISDNLGYSLQVLNEHYDRADNHALHIYDLSMLLFKQLKVLHKLNRMYIKVLRIASYLYDTGRRVSSVDMVANSFDIITNSEIYGASHRDIILAGFTAIMTDPDNFSLANWVKYKDIVTEEDLAAIKKLAVILKLACDLDCTGFGKIQDISCDILGDSVIMKTITEEPADLEIRCGMLNTSEFKKAFGKNLEIL